MTFSVDDLVASLSSNHIGQEAMDIADLQAQLAQALRYSNSQPGPAPCNTPTARTPSNTSWIQSSNSTRRRSSSIASSCSKRSDKARGNDIAEHAMEEDEEFAVEELLGAAPYTTHHTDAAACRQPPPAPGYYHPSATPTSHFGGFDSMDPSLSTFAATDPFYAAAQVPQSQSNSFFAQSGCASQQSPFFVHTQPPQGRPVPFPLAMDTRPRYVAAAGFDT